MKVSKEPSSFRDPSGYVYYSGSRVRRIVSSGYRKHYDLLIRSGLKDKLVKEGLLLDFKELKDKQIAMLVLETGRLPFISYPYEWCFGQLKDAALATLEVEKTALDYGMTLKDASTYNIQFVDGRPMLIDLLSFEKYQEGRPWIAYRQFCEHFFGPLLLMAKSDIRLGNLMRFYLDGIPLDLVSRLLPKTTYLDPVVAAHIHLHARNQQKYQDDNRRKQTGTAKVSLLMMRGILASMEKAMRKLDITLVTEWGEYHRTMNYSRPAQENKKKIVSRMIQTVKPHTVWDLGANTGVFSRLASKRGIFTVSIDADSWAVEQNYRYMKANQEEYILPLLTDLTNPSSNQGWAENERQSLGKRGPADLIMALAFLHHLCLTYNLPFAHVASYLRSLGRHLIIEFVPKEDSNARLLLTRKKDIFPWYNKSVFEKEFGRYFRLIHKTPVGNGSKRVIYLMEIKNS